MFFREHYFQLLCCSIIVEIWIWGSGVVCNVGFSEACFVFNGVVWGILISVTWAEMSGSGSGITLLVDMSYCLQMANWISWYCIAGSSFLRRARDWIRTQTPNRTRTHSPNWDQPRQAGLVIWAPLTSPHKASTDAKINPLDHSQLCSLTRDALISSPCLLWLTQTLH